MTDTRQIIIAFAGKKGSGKDTSYTCIRLWRPEAEKFTFAHKLKRMCVDILGLTEQQAFGTEADKNTLVSHLLWENFPLPAWEVEFSDGTKKTCVVSSQNCYDIIHTTRPGCDFAAIYRFPDTIRQTTKRSGPMTARDVLQFYGTEIFRCQYGDVWADACIRSIRKSGCKLAIITDCRFENEVNAVQAAGGRVIRLTRNPYPGDEHPSETALDQDRFDWDRFDEVLDNAEMDVPAQQEALYGILRRWGVISHKKVSRVHV